MKGMPVALYWGIGNTYRGLAFVLAALAWVLPLGSKAAQADADSAVVIAYHRFGDDRHPSTNTTITQFEAQLREIEAGGYRVLPLPRIIDAFRRKESLPERTIAITVDDAFLSVYSNAWPRLKRLGLPLTLFVATVPVNADRGDYMTWGQIREMAAAGVTIGHHSAGHGHLPDLTGGGLENELESASNHFRRELGHVPTLFAYPFGEFGLREKTAVQKTGFVAAFGQHSGVAYADGDLFALPRFAMNERFGSLDRFRLAANALPLRLIDATPADWVLRGANPPSFGFTLVGQATAAARLNCFASNHPGALRYERLSGGRIEVRLEKAFGLGRSRINCTMPASDRRWRWFGVQFYVPGG
jgi:peptidoglycan/xylan/chitin deacetylase (PgdA/CDA1 family)